MTDTLVAGRYAGALFSLSGKEGLRDRHDAILADLSEMINVEPKLGQTLKSPVISAQEKKALMGELLALLDADTTMRNFCNLLADKNRLGELQAIAASYRSMLDAANGVLRGSVTTAIELNDKKRENLKEKLKEKLGRDIELVFMVDPDILGGLVLTVGDKVLDSSLRAQLAALRETLTRGM